MTALGLTLINSGAFGAADHYGGFAVGLIVVFTGLRVAKNTSERLTDTLPNSELLNEIRTVAKAVPGVVDVEKCYARSSGLQYHVDLHIEVDPELTVRESYDIATETRFAIRRQLDWVADAMSVGKLTSTPMRKRCWQPQMNFGVQVVCLAAVRCCRASSRRSAHVRLRIKATA
jgi:divalent metal cation (Fe/Co/Zn/Cd) transporter